MSDGRVTEDLLDRVYAVIEDGLSAQTLQLARRHIVDTLAACAAGGGMSMNRPYVAAIREIGAPGPFAADGGGARFDLQTAIEVLATLGHSTECDDGYRLGSVHPGVATIPTAALLGVALSAPLERVVLATIAGYEACGLVAGLIHPHSRRRGFHNTGVAGVFGAATAAGALYGFDRAQMESCWGVAASGAGGLFAFLKNGGDTKKLHAGHASREGLRAAQLVRAGLSGPTDVFGAKDGVLAAYGDGPARLGAAAASPVIENCYVKPYACCRHLHPAIDGVMAVMAEHAATSEMIERIEVETYAIARHHVDAPWSSAPSAQLSFRYCLGLAARYGRIDPIHMENQVREDPAVSDIARSVAVDVDPALDALYPIKRPARVRLTFRDGRAGETFVDDPLGSPTLRLDDDRLRDKVARLCSRSPLGVSGEALWQDVVDGPLTVEAAELARVLKPER